MLTRSRKLPRSVWTLFVATLLNRMGTMALPFFILFLTERRHLAPATAGSLFASYGAGSLIAGPGAGLVAARAGARRTMIGSLALTALVLAIVPWIRSAPALALLAFAWALCGEAFRPACASVIAASVPSARQREAYALVRLAVNLGMSIGPAIGGFLASRSFGALFVVDGATSLAAAVWLALPFGRDVEVQADEAPRGVARDARRGQRALLVHLLAVALVALVAYQAVSSMAFFFVHDLGLTTATYGVVFASSGLLIVVFELPLTSYLRRWSHRGLLVAGASLIAIGFGALSIVRGLMGVATSTVIWTVGEMLLGPAAAARAAELESDKRPGMAIGLYSGVWSAAFAVGPWLGMESLARLGSIRHWVTVGCVGLAAAALFALEEDRSRLTAP